MKSYASGFIDALALAAVAILLLIAAALASGCEPSTAPVDTLFDACDNPRDNECAAEGEALPSRNTCIAGTCTRLCEHDSDCGEGTCGPDSLGSRLACTEPQVAPRSDDELEHEDDHRDPTSSDPNDLQPATRRPSTGRIVLDVRVVQLEVTP